MEDLDEKPTNTKHQTPEHHTRVKDTPLLRVSSRAWTGRPRGFSGAKVLPVFVFCCRMRCMCRFELMEEEERGDGRRLRCVRVEEEEGRC